MKRFTETKKWSDPWFRKLPSKYKCFWQYILDHCDNAGIWVKDIETACYFIGERIEGKEALDLFNAEKERIKIHANTKWEIIDFIEFQFGKLKGNNPLHSHILSLIDKHKDRGIPGVFKGYLNPLSKGKGKGRGKGILRGRGEGEGENIKICNEPVTEPLHRCNKELSLFVSQFWDYFLLKTQKKFILNKDRKDLILRRLKDYSLEDMKRAVDNFVADTWEGRKDHLDLIYCIGRQKGKPDNLEKWINYCSLNRVELGIKQRNPHLTDEQVKDLAKHRKKEA